MVKIVKVREQLTNQRHVLDEEFRPYAGREWCIRPLKTEGAPAALTARIAVDDNNIVTLVCDTAYFIGLDWLIPGKLAVHVEPKMNDANRLIEVDYLSMLNEALKDHENLQFLTDLQFCRTQAPRIPTKKENSGLLLFLLIQFLTLITRIRQRGLKRNFHCEEQAFVYGKKGRILLSQSLKAARTASLTDRLHCSVQQFDVDTPANQYLKCALRTTLLLLQTPAFKQERHLTELARLSLRAFEAVSDVTHPAPIKIRKVNPVFRVYTEALRLAELILSSATLGHLATSGRSSVPPYWIDMARLFELFIYKKLRQAITPNGAVQYQFAAHYQYLDYLCKAPGTPLPFFIADAKYKPRYSSQPIDKDDLRQLAGYARLTKVEQQLRRCDWGCESASRLIPCVIIYPSLTPDKTTIDLSASLMPIDGWTEFLKIEVSIPLKR